MTAWVEDDDLEVLLLERYCSGTASPEEAARIDVWFGEHPDQRVWYEQLRIGLNRGDFPHMSAEQSKTAQSEVIRAALQRRPGTEDTLSSAVRSDDTTKAMSPKYSGRGLSLGTQTIRQTLWSTAAALMVAVVIIAVGWNLGVHSVGQRASLSVLTYSTGDGQRANITLPDGGMVALNVASRLEVPMDYMAGNHTVQILGEG